MCSKRRTILSASSVAAAALLLAAALVPAAGAVEPKTEPAATRVVRGIQAWLDGTRDLAGTFRQALVSGALGSGLEERGRVYVQRPGRMRWDYRDPDRKVAIVVGDRTWLWIEDESQLYLGRLGEHGSLLPELMAADRRLDEWFEAELLHAGDERDPVIRVRLRPRSESESFESVVLSVREPGYAIEAAEVLDAAGNRMLYHFTKMRRNRGLSGELFRFEPPEGTTVVGSH